MNTIEVLKEDANRAQIGGWIKYAASTWGLVFAAIHFYWTFGGKGFFVNPESSKLLASDPQAYVAGNALASTLFVLLGLLPLALVVTRSTSSSTVDVFHRPLLIATGVVGVGMIVYGLTGIQNGLVLLGIVDDFFGRPLDILRTNLFVWTPVWLLGGILFTATAWFDRRRSRNIEEMTGD